MICLPGINYIELNIVSVFQAPVATILNDLSPIPVPVKVTNQKASAPPSHMTPKGLQDNTPDVKAMRYVFILNYTHIFLM